MGSREIVARKYEKKDHLDGIGEALVLHPISEVEGGPPSPLVKQGRQLVVGVY